MESRPKLPPSAVQTCPFWLAGFANTPWLKPPSSDPSEEQREVGRELQLWPGRVVWGHRARRAGAAPQARAAEVRQAEGEPARHANQNANSRKGSLACESRAPHSSGPADSGARGGAAKKSVGGLVRSKTLPSGNISFESEDGSPSKGGSSSSMGKDDEDGDGFENPVADGNMFETEAVDDAAPDASNPDDWGSLALGGIKQGEVDEFIVNWCKNSCASSWLDATVLFCIIFNTFLLAYAGPANIHPESQLFAMMVIDLVLTLIFTIEMFIRIIALGFYDRTGELAVPRYMNEYASPPLLLLLPRAASQERDRALSPCSLTPSLSAAACSDWNKMDFFVVISSWVNVIVEVTGIQLGVSMSSLRALRIMRVLKAFKSIEGIRVILATLAAAVPHTGNVVAFLAFMFVVSGIIGVQMFRGLTRHRCEYSSFELMAHLGVDRFPMADGSVDGGNVGPWDVANETGFISQTELSMATVLNNSAPGPYPGVVDPTYEYPIGIGVWGTYCNLDSDCPLYNVRDQWNRTQTCQRSLNPGKTFSNYDSSPEAWITLFINMACLYWWETAHRYVDANSGHEPFCTGTPEDLDLYSTCEGAFLEATNGDPTTSTFLDCPDGCRYRTGGPGSIIAWAFGAFNVVRTLSLPPPLYFSHCDLAATYESSESWLLVCSSC
jgi:hypothetical protein